MLRSLNQSESKLQNLKPQVLSVGQADAEQSRAQVRPCHWEPLVHRFFWWYLHSHRLHQSHYSNHLPVSAAPVSYSKHPLQHLSSNLSVPTSPQSHVLPARYLSVVGCAKGTHHPRTKPQVVGRRFLPSAQPHASQPRQALRDCMMIMSTLRKL